MFGIIVKELSKNNLGNCVIISLFLENKIKFQIIHY